MSVHQLKRRILVSLALVLSAAPLFALNPAARSEPRMVFAPNLHVTVLFGGSTPVDRGTAKIYELDDTWERQGSQWIQRFPAHNPGARGAHLMIYDSKRGRVVLFGGHNGNTDLNDTWIYQNGDWVPLLTVHTPTPRFLAGGAYDAARDRFVVFGGNQHSADGKITSIYDTWEFDGTDWVQTSASGPAVLKPILVYDAARNQTIMLGVNDKSETLMYAYDPSDASWKQLKPTTLPACANEATMVFDDATQKVFFTGGVCAGSSTTEDSLEWDGTNWTKVDVTLAAGRVFGAAMTYDSDQNQVIMFGGATVLGTLRSNTMLYANGIWIDATSSGLEPEPRSLFAFVTDPVNNTVLMYGGVDDVQTFTDFWKFENGHWNQIANGDEPASCFYPLAVYDTDRQKAVMLCSDSSTWEYDGAKWTPQTPKHLPSLRRFSSMAYDQTLKKTVLFGGYDTNYFDTTWVWDGKDWTQVAKKNPPPSRALASLWYDPNLKKTVMYGGIGRVTSTDRLSRFSDMWTFDGNAWTQLNAIKNTPGQSTGTPGMRYGAQLTVDPSTNKVLLFGGMRVDTDSAGVQTQVYADDTWQFDGTNWTQLTPGGPTPPARENAGITFDPVRNELVMFSGFAATYRTDTWGYANGAWHQRIEGPTPRRRAAH
jgi:hypothetical protein